MDRKECLTGVKVNTKGSSDPCLLFLDGSVLDTVQTESRQSTDTQVLSSTAIFGHCVCEIVRRVLVFCHVLYD